MSSEEKESKENAQGLLKKVTQMIEEPEKQEPPMPQEPKKEVPAKKKTAVRERALITYLALLFGVAFILVLLSFVMQQRDISQAHKNTSNALSRAEQLQDDNRDLAEKLQEVEEELEDYQYDNEELEDTIAEMNKKLLDKDQEISNLKEEIQKAAAKPQQTPDAYELLLQAQKALQEEKTAEFRAAMDKLAAQKDTLGTSGKALYEELLAAMPKEQ